MGEVVIFKDVDVNDVNVEVYFNETVNCNDVNIFHYKLTNITCNSVKIAKLVTGSLLTGNVCYYELQCNQNDVSCTIELYMTDENTSFSICEMAVMKNFFFDILT